MAQFLDPPDHQNAYQQDHVLCLLASLRHWTGRNLVDPNLPGSEQSRQLFYAPFAVLSHDAAADPVLTYANLTGLRLFELSWQELVQTPSRLTAEAVYRDQRAALLTEVSRRGFIDDYRGVRISKSGRRFVIESATVWNLRDSNGAHCGQAAAFNEWKFLDVNPGGSDPTST